LPRELISDLAMLERLVEFDGRDVVDIGCGGGALVRDLTARGARVTGVEVSEEQLATALSRARDDGARYLVGLAQALPLSDDSVDVAVFMRSFHHVPAGELMQALRESRRVLRPGGVLYIAEPLTEGDFFTLTSLVEDELEVRRAAQNAIDQARLAGFEEVQSVDYDVEVELAGVAALRERIVSVDPQRAEIFDAREAEIAEAFERLGSAGEHPGERRFIAPMRADVLRPAPAD
jgi:ubiquinone/menaquinone biosynthesis C-methylase UbiE